MSEEKEKMVGSSEPETGDLQQPKPKTTEELRRELESRALAGDPQAIRQILEEEQDFEH